MQKSALWLLGAALVVVVAAGFVAYTQFFPDGAPLQEQGTGPCPETKYEQGLLDNSTAIVSAYFIAADGERFGPYRGLGFVEGQYVVTAAHIINQDFEQEIVRREIFLERFLHSERTSRTSISRIAYENQAVDFALLEMPQELQRDGRETFGLAQRSDVSYGETVCFYLHPFSGKLDKTIEGTVSRFPPPYGAEAWFGFKIEAVLAHIVPGASGGPAFIRTPEGLKIAGIIRRMVFDPESKTTTIQLQATDATYAAGEILRKTGIDISRGR